MKRFLLMSLTVIMTVGLVVGLALPGLANTDDEPTKGGPWSPGRQMLRGEVSEVNYDDDHFTIEDKDGDEVDIRVNEATCFFRVNPPQRIMEELRTRERLQEAEGERERIREEVRERLQPANGFLESVKGMFQKGRGPEPEDNQITDQGNERPKELQGALSWLHPFGEAVTFDDLEDGDQVAVFAVETGDDEEEEEDGYLAKLVFIIEPSEYGRVTGEITDIDDETITIQPDTDDEEDPIKILYDEDTIFNLRLKGIYTLDEDLGIEVSITYVEDDGEYYARTVTTVGLQPATD